MAGCSSVADINVHRLQHINMQLEREEQSVSVVEMAAMQTYMTC